jgi:hypothetical protein
MHPRAPMVVSKLLPPSGELHPAALDRICALTCKYLSPSYQPDKNQSETEIIGGGSDNQTARG